MTHEPAIRAVLAGTANPAAGLASCSSVTSRARPVSILAAESLQNALTKELLKVQ